jgi:hypothetical protein
MRWIQSDLPIEVCDEHPELSFRRGWTSLDLYLRLHHRVNIDADAAPSSLYDAVTKLGNAFKPPLVTTSCDIATCRFVADDNGAYRYTAALCFAYSKYVLGIKGKASEVFRCVSK